MKSLVRVLPLIYALATGSIALAKDWAGENWEFLYEQDGVRVYRKEIAGTNMKGVGGEGLVDASPGKILWLLTDHEHKAEWIDHFKSARTAEDHPPEYNTQYSVFDLPFPVTDRDFLVKQEFSVDPALKALIVNLHSVDMASVPLDKDLVRGQVVKGKFIMTPQPDGKTLIQAEYLTDPKGMIPAWLVNMLQKKWPYTTLMALRQQVKKPYVKEWEPYTNYWKAKLEAASTASTTPAPAKASVK